MEPEAYTIGWQPFLGLKIWLDSRPLIPRPETEWWTERLMSEAGAIFSATGCSKLLAEPEGAKKSLPQAKFLDLCAGSGAIGCAALKYLPEAEVWFGEVDPAHEATIKKNIEANGLDASRAHVCIGDLFAPFVEGLTFNIIAANPPYIPEARDLPSEVADFEPALALRAGPDGLALIRRIAAELPKRLATSGVAWVECDSAHAEDARDLFIGLDLPAEICADQYGAPRVICTTYSVQ